MDETLIYLDNAATVFPKPAEVLAKTMEIYSSTGASPGRGSYDLAASAEILVDQARERVADFFNAPDPNRVVFTANATDALNLAILGMAEPGCHVVSSRLEHNSVLRPLHHLQQQGLISLDLVPFDSQGFIDPDELARTIRPETKLVVLSHASNVLGTIQPLEHISRLCRERQIPLVIDAAQSAGLVPVDISAWHLGAVAFTGHKSLLGPHGIGGLVINSDLEVKPTRFGGTGVDSSRLEHTPTYPHRLEAGTPNLLGIIGLAQALAYLDKLGQQSIHDQEYRLILRLRRGLAEIPQVKIYSPEPDDPDRFLAILTCNLMGLDPHALGAILDGDYGIAVRTGLHCAPLVHQDLGTTPTGAVRFSLGPSNTEAHIDAALDAMSSIAEQIQKQPT
ncbi:MAG: aminotransferase class V-fold PLP-dependent enzyme [Desulfarculaceae bacterium]|jgi:cysteine desulfurase family protein